MHCSRALLWGFGTVRHEAVLQFHQHGRPLQRGHYCWTEQMLLGPLAVTNGHCAMLITRSRRLNGRLAFATQVNSVSIAIERDHFPQSSRAAPPPA